MEMLDRLDELADMVETAKSLPLSQSCVLPRADLLDLIDEVRAALPDTVREADVVVQQRDDILDDAERESQAIVAEAEAAATKIINEATEIANNRRSAAAAEAEQVLAEARMQSALIVDSHTITVTARDEATRVINEATEKAEMIVVSTKHRATTLLAKAEQSLSSALDEVHRSLAELDSPSHQFIADLDADNADEPVGLRTNIDHVDHREDEFYDFGTDDEVDDGGSGYYR